MLRRSRSFCVLLAAAFAFQVSDLSRLVYVRFNLAPTCPVVGEAAQKRTSCCPEPQRTHTVVEDDGACHTDDPQAPSQPVSPDDCSTCRMLAVAHQIGEIPVPEAALFDNLSGYEPILQTSLPRALSDKSNQARAPPGV